MNINNAISIKSDHSIGESILQIDGIVSKSKEFGFEAIALVDTMSISAMVPFTNQCKKAGIKPIIGCTLRVYDDPRYRKPKKGSGEVEKKNNFYQLKVYVKSDNGLRSLMKLLSKGGSEEYFYYHSRVGLDDVMELEDVIVTTGDLFNLFHHPDYVQILKKLKSKFETFIEIVPINTPLFDTLNKRAIEACKRGGALIAGYPILYSEEGDADTLDVLRAITSNAKMDSRSLPIPYTRDFSFDTPKKLAERLIALSKRVDMENADIKSCFENLDWLVSECKYEFKKLDPCLPKMAENEFFKLVEECKKGWEVRFSGKILGHKPLASDMPIYKQRLAYELGVLKKLNFSNYFLVVQNIVNWSKSNGVIVGPGRGSIGGSLVAYLVGISDVDPIRFNLIFERFINPERTDLPDADLDFMSSRRGEVVQYISEHFGSENVAGISNYSTLGPASAIRDVSRVHNLEIFEYACSKQMEKEHGTALSLDESASRVPDIAKFQLGYPKIWNHAVKLEGCMRNLGQHAAGVIVSGEPIVNRAVVTIKDGGLPVVNWDKRTVEGFGLIKLDVLGLSTLDIFGHALRYIKERHGVDLDLLKIPLDDVETLKLFGKGDTTAVFQFDGKGMKKLLKDLAMLSPLTFEDVAAATALYRPGPIDSGLLDKFVAIKQGKALPQYDHPSVEFALKETYGIIVYQEEVMQVCRDLAGFSLTEADHIRKSIGKKDREKMATFEDAFVKGASSGFVEVELDDGTVVKIHSCAKFKVEENSELHTVDEIFANSWTPVNLQPSH